jgi:two-component system, chemotaxis family, sensor kinase CheA
MDELLQDFLTETSESLAVLDVELVQFEQDPSNLGILQNIFRLVHTIKGTCGFLGLPRLEHLAHAGENVLGKFRDGALDVTPPAVSLVLSSIDRIKELLGSLEETGSEPEGSDEDLIAALNATAQGEPLVVDAAAVDAPAADEAEGSGSRGPVTSDQGFPVAAELLDEVAASEASGITAADTEAEWAAMEMAASAEAAPEPAPKPKAVPKPKAEPKPKAKPAAPVAAKAAAKADGPPHESVASQSIRVNVGLLENLMTLVSELVLTRNQLLQMIRGQDDSEFQVPLQRLSLITSDLQESVMKTRMQPIGNAWSKLPRIVRDLALETGKKIDLQMVGADTELDRQVLELIKDPLTHMVRNSADHGLESGAERLAAGKSEMGVIRLDAYHEGGHIIIQIADDGKGLNTDRIRDKILSNGMVSEAELAGMPDQQVHQYIMRAGFSTAEKVTSVSGRGVGMDVVKSNIEKIGGTIEFVSREGRGTTFTIKIPLTLAIVSALIVACGGERFAIPQISVLELVRASEHAETKIELINEAPVLRLRDRLLPLVVLSQLLDLEDGTGTDVHHLTAAEKFVVVCQVGTYRFGVIVDRVFDTEEIVVKPVSPILRDISMFSGNTILGDGSVIMILDPNGIAATTSEVTVAQDQEAATESQRAMFGEETTSLLVFRAGSEELKAVPLELVARLEEIDLAVVEHSQGLPLVQYRGHIMPLISFNPGHMWAEEGRQPIVVFTEGERSMGLVVEDIIDIVEDRMVMELSTEQPGLIGTAVIAGKATDVIDAGYYLTQAFADWFGRHDGPEFGTDGTTHRILLVDDSAFFRNLMKPQLVAAGYEVMTAEDPIAALALRDRGMTFDAIISDIEMPKMNGLEFVKAVRADGSWKALPMIALSSYATQADVERGMEYGFDDYVGKFNRDAIFEALRRTLTAQENAAQSDGGEA